jgi:hypothetical protein
LATTAPGKLALPPSDDLESFIGGTTISQHDLHRYPLVKD